MSVMTRREAGRRSVSARRSGGDNNSRARSANDRNDGGKVWPSSLPEGHKIESPTRIAEERVGLKIPAGLLAVFIVEQVVLNRHE